MARNASDKTAHAQKKKLVRTQAPATDKPASSKAVKKERLSKGAKIALAIVGCLAMILSVSSMACSGVLNQVAGGKDYNLTGGVAAMVNETKITEDTITEDIMQAKSGYEDDAAWAQYLVDSGLTPESLREQTIDSYVDQVLVSQAKREHNVSATQEELDAAWQESAESYGGEDALLELVEMLGYDKSTYQQNMLAPQIETEKLEEAVAPVDVTDDDVLSYINDNLSTYNDARRSSHILFKVADDGSDDEEQKAAAQEVLDKINSGELTFEDAAKEHSDDGSGAEGGDVGWDCLTTFVDEYQTALDGLGKDEMSGLVRSTYGYHIILCTDTFSVEGSVASLDDVPEEIRDYVRNILETQESQAAYDAWFEEYKAAATITVNPMPEDVPYNVSLEGVEPSATDEGEGADSGASSEGEASGEGAE